MMHTLQHLGFSFLTDHVDLYPHINSIKQRISDVCLQEQNANIHSSAKLSFYTTFYVTNKRARYVDTLINRCDRSQISKLRLSAHQLSIEKGRYFNMPRHERLCQLCNANTIENEEHFLLHCPAYADSRSAAFKKLENHIENIQNYHNEKKLQLLLNSNSIHILKTSSAFITNCFSVRLNKT